LYFGVYCILFFVSFFLYHSLMNKVAHKAFSVGYRIHRKQRSKNVGFSLRFVGYIAPITDALKPNKTNAHCPYIRNSESVVDFGRHYLVF